MAGRIVATVLFLISISATAYAEGIQVQCGPEAGRAFAAEQGMISAADAGWYDDTVRGETVIRIDLDTGEVDVRFKDATQVWQTVEDQGGSAFLFAANANPAGFMVLVGYPGSTVETLVIAEIQGPSARLIHTVSRVMPQISNARVMVATCVAARF